MQNITDHIYGRTNVITRKDRPNLFLKELQIYMDFLNNKFEEAKTSMGRKEGKYFKVFINNMKSGIDYYQNLFNEVTTSFNDAKGTILNELEKTKTVLNQFQRELEAIPVKV
ncbi:hypothetical protein JCM19302_1493 [Jejuia pallidilutea]|uniref:Uncharacterized protein n=1 Tax=Jejuia pallidilutea TaxID=504487 RepID=A0A090W567_9FLAO|nr:hypothetical protein JCM19302_1493 [Jejuia pallidilutea]